MSDSNSTDPIPHNGFSKWLNQSNFDGIPNTYRKFVPSSNGMKAMQNWLGKKGYEMYIKTLSQSVTNAIKKDQEEAEKAARKLKDTEEGKDPDD